ncbi:MAG: hypothetical protein ACLSFT_08800 [Ruminococcus callidus]
MITLKEKSISSAILAYLHYLEVESIEPQCGNSRYVVEKCQFHQKTMTTKST